MSSFGDMISETIQFAFLIVKLFAMIFGCFILFIGVLGVLFLGGLIIFCLCWLVVSVLSFAAEMILRVPSLVGQGASFIIRELTIAPRRFRWWSMKGFADTKTPLLAQTEHEYSCDRIATNKLCKRCYRVIEASRLISGSILPFVRRTELHEWELPLKDSELRMDSCHLCRLIWFSIGHDTRQQILATHQQGLGAQAGVQMLLVIWKDNANGISAKNIYGLQLFEDSRDAKKKLVAVTSPFTITEEKLNDPPSSMPVSDYTGSPHCIELAKSWITECETHHGIRCGGELSSSNTYLPARLLYVGDSSSRALRLVETSAMELAARGIQYAALSYLRGEDEIPIRQQLTSDKKELWKSHINFQAMPLTFQHTIHLTRRLGLSYLWIDMLCIIQDEEDRKEWTVESKNMGKIYANAHCTISASGSPDADGGCFQKRSQGFQEFPCHIRVSKSKALTIRASGHSYGEESFLRNADQGPLSQSASAMQERLVSRRVLHFGAQFLFFECGTHVATEIIPEGRPYHRASQTKWPAFFKLRKGAHTAHRNVGMASSYNPVDGYRRFFSQIQHYHSSTPNITQELDLHTSWFELVSKYTSAKPSRPRDRATGIHGLAQYIAGTNDLRYMHGLWHRHIIFDLLWYLKGGLTQRTDTTAKRIPTWSWQSVEGHVHQLLVSNTTWGKKKRCTLIKVAELVNANTDQSPPEDEDQTFITLKCPVFRASLLTTSFAESTSINIHTPQHIVTASFSPDVTDIDTAREFFCAELVREVFFTSTWKNGLVLQRKLSRGENGIETVYRRVGRFWLEWPRDDGGGDVREERGKSGGERMFKRGKTQVVKIE